MKFGFLTGLKTEAELALRLSPLVRFTAARPDRTADLAWQLIREGATILISFGIAGALDPKLQPGTLIAADEVRDETGANVRTNRSLFLRLQALMPDIVTGPVYGSEKIVSSAPDKKALHEKSGALAVDMESHTVALVAQDAGIPFAVLRAIADPATLTVPSAALIKLKDDGTPDIAAIMKSALKRPQDLPALMRVGIDYSRALAALRRLTYIRFLPEAE